MRSSRIIVALAAFAVAASPAVAQSWPPYLDDRSDPAALIRSLYNAIQLKEHARAWSYFSSPPAASFEAYANGFANTAFVRVETGGVSAEGAAGSTFYEVPVILQASNADGSETVFTGCYVVRQVNAAIQDPPFRPLTIESGRLRLATDGAGFPADCGGTGPEATADEVMRVFTAAYRDICISLDPEFNREGLRPETYELRFRYASDDPSMPERVFTLYRVWCSRGAYTEGHVYYLEDDLGWIRPVSFAQPITDAVYADEGMTRLSAMTLAGFGTFDELSLSQFEPETATVTAYIKWRGLGDASESGTWVFEDGAFRLDSYEVDPTYDGEFNPIAVVAGGQVVLP